METCYLCQKRWEGLQAHVCWGVRQPASHFLFLTHSASFFPVFLAAISPRFAYFLCPPHSLLLFLSPSTQFSFLSHAPTFPVSLPNLSSFPYTPLSLMLGFSFLFSLPHALFLSLSFTSSQAVCFCSFTHGFFFSHPFTFSPGT